MVHIIKVNVAVYLLALERKGVQYKAFEKRTLN